MSTDLQQVRIEFAEVMSGYVSPEATTFDDGFERGRAAGHRLSLHVAVRIGCLAGFLDGADHAGTLSGHVDCPLLGGICPVQSGVFRLMPDTADLDRKVMHYLVYCTAPDGKRFTFAGEKQAQHTAPFDLWHDTTTLHVNIFDGHIDPGATARASLRAVGIIRLGLPDFIKVLASLRATDARGGISMGGLVRFGEFFAGKLWEVYGPHLPPASNRPTRRYAQNTTEGVQDAQVSVHPFSSADGLNLQLTRFLRESGDDAVLVVHGLTSSSDMFIMPEHENLVQHLLGQGYGDVWALDYRGSRRFPYNLQRSRYSFDDIALFDHPAAIAELRRHIGPHRRLHVIAHCVGALTMSMALFGKTVQGISSLIVNSVSLTPVVPRWSAWKLAFGPWASDNLLGAEYFNPGWRRQAGWSPGKMVALAADLVHRECNSPECHMLSFMWGSGWPALFNHANILPETHDRLGDLFGGVSVNYYRHVSKMIRSGNRAVKFEPGNPRYAALPDDYLTHAAQVDTPILFMQGQDNHVFAGSNIRCHALMEKLAPGRHALEVFAGYGHQDVFMGKNAAIDIFPRIVAFLRRHGGAPARSPVMQEAAAAAAVAL